MGARSRTRALVAGLASALLVAAPWRVLADESVAGPPVDEGASAGDRGATLPFDGPVAPDTLVQVDMVEAPLDDVARWVAAVTGRNLAVQPDALDGATITVVSPRPVPAADVWPLFLAALSANGLTVQDRGTFVRIVPATER